jgi:hypothetical protein
LFEVIAPGLPNDWVREIGGDGELYAYLSALAGPGFFEDFFDGKSRAVSTFWRTVNRRLARASNTQRRRSASA